MIRTEIQEGFDPNSDFIISNQTPREDFEPKLERDSNQSKRAFQNETREQLKVNPEKNLNRIQPERFETSSKRVQKEDSRRDSKQIQRGIRNESREGFKLNVVKRI